MKNLKKEIVISNKFREQIDGLNIYDQMKKNGQKSFSGSMTKLDDDLYILRDEKGQDVCGILDRKSFLEALLDTEVAHLWVPAKGVKNLCN